MTEKEIILNRVTGEVTPEIKGKLKERAEVENKNLAQLVGEILTNEFKKKKNERN